MAARVATEFSQPLLVRINYVKSVNKAKPNVRTTLRTLGFKYLNQSIVHKNVLPIRGMINTVKNYVTVEPIVWTPELAKTQPPKSEEN